MKKRILFFTALLALALLVGCHAAGLSRLSKATAIPTQIEEAHEYAHFYFVQITDTHFGDANHIERTRAIVERINHLPMRVEFIVHTGDITMNGIDNQATVNSGLSVLNKLAVPIHYVPGNHDILPEKLEATKQAYSDNFEGLITSQKYDGVTFIFIYTEPLAKNFLVDGYKPL